MIDKPGFPVFKKVEQALLNWSPKLAALAEELYNFLVPLEWGQYTPSMEGYPTTLTITPSLQQGYYFRLFKTVFISIRVQGTLGGVAADVIRVGIPIEAYSAEGMETFIASCGDAGQIVSGHAYMAENKTSLYCRRYNYANWTAGFVSLIVNGFYRVA